MHESVTLYIIGKDCVTLPCYPSASEDYVNRIKKDVCQMLAQMLAVK